jgi:hypothetical protein
MLMMELLNIANIVDVSADLSPPFNYLTDIDHQYGQTLTCAEPVSRHGTIRTLRVPSTEAPGPISPTSGYICTGRLCTAWICGHIYGWDVAS